MKKIFLAGLLLQGLFLSALAQVSYHIEGAAPNSIAVLYLKTLNNQPVDTAIVKNGRFLFEGQVPEQTFLNLQNERRSFSLDMLADGEPIYVDVLSGTVKGSELNVKLNNYEKQVAELQKQYIDDYKSFVALDSTYHVQRDSIRQHANMTVKKMNALVKDIIETNADNVLPALYIALFHTDFTYEELKKYLADDKKYAAHPLCAAARKSLMSMEIKSIGNKFIDLAENDTAGVSHRLNEYIGKGNYVLVDFWASWCGPCMNEMPNVKANYDKYHSKGFEIVGLSLDRSADAWKRTIREKKLDWIHLSDIKFWQSLAAQVYGINSIPSSILFNGEGYIEAVDLRGEKLGEKLKEIYGF